MVIDPIEELLQYHIAYALRGYQSNLSHAMWVVKNNWLPDAESSETCNHLETLKRYMANIGRPENDEFLLRLGLTAAGTQRGIVPPAMVLDSNRGGFSERRQREAEGQITRLRQALAIGKELDPSMSSDCSLAVSELASRVTTIVTPAEQQWISWYQSMPSRDAERLASRAIQLVKSKEEPVKDIGKDILQRLACFRGSPLSEACLLELINLQVLWPSSIYRDGGEVVAERLLTVLDTEFGRNHVNHLLIALGWTRAQVALSAFNRWRDSPPNWASGLHLPPENFLHDSGWSLDADGRGRELISLRCFRLPMSDESNTSSIRCRHKLLRKCPSCNGALSWLFDFKNLRQNYFLDEFAGAPRRVLCCLHCSMFSPTFVKYDNKGESEWLAPFEDCRFENTSDNPQEIHRKIAVSQFSLFGCAEPFCLEDASTFGGIPMWLQGSEYPFCLECGESMTFLAQHDNGSIQEEGIYYAFFCGECSIAAVQYQQT